MANAHELSNRTIDCYRLIADNCLSLGNTAEAIHYLKEANRRMDTLSSINMQRLMRERNMQDSIEHKEQLAEVRMQKITDQRRMLAVVGSLAAVLLVLLIVIGLTLRSRNRMIKSIVEQNVKAVEKQKMAKQHIAQLERQLESLREAPVSQGGIPAGPAEPTDSDGAQQAVEAGPPADKTSGQLLDDDERMQELYDRVCQVMENEKLYHEPKLTREKLAKLLGTNRTYLSTVIHDKSGMSYQQFVNAYRINEAIELLSDASQTDRPMKQLWSDLGFTSPSTFYKLFQ